MVCVGKNGVVVWGEVWGCIGEYVNESEGMIRVLRRRGGGEVVEESNGDDIDVCCIKVVWCV